MQKIATIPTIVLILLFNLCCSKNNKPGFLTFQLDKQSTVIIKNVGDNKDHTILGLHYAFLPANFIYNHQYTDVITLNKNNECILNYKITLPSQVQLIIDKKLFLPLFLVPGDTLYVKINLSDPSKILKGINFEGKYASVNEYQIRRFEKFDEDIAEKCSAVVRANLPVPEMQNSVDSISAIEMDFLKTYNKTNSLPEWYFNYEMNQIVYISAHSKSYYLYYRKWQNIDEIYPAEYYTFLNDIRINNEDAVISTYYYYFLTTHFRKSYPKDVSSFNLDERKRVAALTYLNYTDSLLTGEVNNIFKTYIVSQFIIDLGMYTLAEKIIGELKSKKFSDKYLDYLERYLKNKKTLKPGVTAPDFYLADINNKYKTLADYKGNVILLNFWFPGCTPCIQEIPFEQKLVEDFKHKNFRLINICFFSSDDSWRDAINKFKMKGVHLFANENWQKKIIEEYKIGGYPHYTLIDKDGKIISNNPKRPSEGIAEIISNLLSKQ